MWSIILLIRDCRGGKVHILKETRPTWIEINLDNLAHNIKEVKRNTKNNELITAVVKADAYGHGSIQSAKTFLNNGADRLAVATVSEAIELRRAGIDAPILILGYTPNDQCHLVLKHDIIQTIYDYEDARILSDIATDLNKDAIIHIKIDSGMNRIGFLPSEGMIDQIVKIYKLPNIKVEGIFSHLATADDKDKTYTMLQYKRFMGVIEKLETQGVFIPIKHISNSAAIIDFPEYGLNMVRAGIIIYGFYPSDDVHKDRIVLKPAMTLKTRISNVKLVPKGTGIGRSSDS